MQPLAFLPISIFARVEDADFEFSASESDKLLANVDRRGLLQLQPSSKYLRATVKVNQEVRPGVLQEAAVEVQFRRLQYALIPASVHTLYAAQGDAWYAVLVDLAKPPVISRKDKEHANKLFWLAIYVLISRARSLNGLLILRLPVLEDFNCGPPVYIIERSIGF